MSRPVQNAIVIGLLMLLAVPSQSGIFKKKEERIDLPKPSITEGKSVAQALQQAKATKKYKSTALTLETISQLLWAGQGVIDKKTGERTAPSVMNFHMLDTYLLVDQVQGLDIGLYRYHPKKHQLALLRTGDVKKKMCQALRYGEVRQAPVSVILVGLSIRTPNPEWLYLEAGHAAQNIILQAAALDLGTRAMTGFKEKKIRAILQLSEKEIPIYVLPIGKRK